VDGRGLLPARSDNTQFSGATFPPRGAEDNSIVANTNPMLLTRTTELVKSCAAFGQAIYTLTECLLTGRPSKTLQLCVSNLGFGSGVLAHGGAGV
jgi:hypothetical protein